jgi:hypothetical protein
LSGQLAEKNNNKKTKRDFKGFVEALVQPPDGPDIRPLFQGRSSEYNAKKFAHL